MKIKTTFEFDAAHRLVGCDGECKHLHGHMWKVEVEVEGNKVDDVGIMIDFKELKKIKDYYDHKTILKVCKENQDLVYTITKTCGSESIAMMHGNPTAENIATQILDSCKLQWKDFSFKIKVWESQKSYAEVEFKYD